jgi:diguanylate cyclase (GGDEF)-like protein
MYIKKRQDHYDQILKGKNLELQNALSQGKFLESEISQLSASVLTDELTKAYNRRFFSEKIRELFNKHKQTEQNMSVMMVDIDHFKKVNDNYGHEIGDQILRQVSQRFSRSLPTGSVLARLGGDEFGVLINGSYEQTLEAAYALQATLSYPFVIKGVPITIGVSIGLANNDGESNLLERADAAMYEAKRNGEGVVTSLSAKGV